jgi:hypothetical protein
MKNTFTQNDFNLFFNESNITEQSSDGTLLKQFFNKEEEMIVGKNLLQEIAVSPEKRILDSILSYSRALMVFKTKRAGIVNALMN